MNAPSATIVRHITRDHVTIEPAKGYSVVVFNVTGGAVEAVIAADDGSETIRLLVEAPGPGRTMAIKTVSGVVDIVYAEKSHA